MKQHEESSPPSHLPSLSRLRAAISSFWKIGDISLALEQLRADLESGAWHETHADLLTRRELDCGYRLIVSDAH